MTIISDEILVQKCLQGDHSAQRLLYDRFKVSLFRLCLRYAKDRPEAEDMLQDGFIQIFQDLHQFQGKGALGGWLRRVMVNTALQCLRKQKRLGITVDLDQVVDSYQTQENVFAQMEAKALTKLIQQLPDGYRVVFNMYVVEGYSHKEIAAQLKVSINTSKSQLSKAKARMRRIIEKMMV